MKDPADISEEEQAYWEEKAEKAGLLGGSCAASCSACGDKLRGHEDESATQCRWCVTGWIPCDESNFEQNSQDMTPDSSNSKA